MTDTRVRKMLSHINVKMHLPKSYYIFHAFLHSGATLDYRAHAPTKGIKDYGNWTSDWMWRYIQTHQESGAINIAINASLFSYRLDLRCLLWLTWSRGKLYVYIMVNFIATL